MTSASGTIVFVFTTSSGSDCTSQLASTGGSYDKLPCELHYSFTAARTKAP